MREIKFRAWIKERDFVGIIQDAYMAIQGTPDLETLQSFMHHYGDESTLMQYTGLKGYEGDIIDVCIFLVSPSNPDNDQHFRGVIEFQNGSFVFIIHKYLKFDGSKSEWVKLKSNHLPFYEAELDEDGTYTVNYFDFLAMSSNMGEFNDDNVEIIGNIHENPDLLTQ